MKNILLRLLKTLCVPLRVALSTFGKQCQVVRRVKKFKLFERLQTVFALRSLESDDRSSPESWILFRGRLRLPLAPFPRPSDSDRVRSERLAYCVVFDSKVGFCNFFRPSREIFVVRKKFISRLNPQGFYQAPRMTRVRMLDWRSWEGADIIEIWSIFHERRNADRVTFPGFAKLISAREWRKVAIFRGRVSAISAASISIS